MKKKTINAVCSKKFDDFLASIKDDTVKKLVKENSIITGGAIASMLLGEKVNDFDIYFTNKQTVKAVAKYYVKAFNSSNNAAGYVLDGEHCTKADGKLAATLKAIGYSDTDIEHFSGAGGVGMNMTPDRVKIIFPSKGIASEPGFGLESEDVVSYDTAVDIIQQVTENEEKEKYRPVFLSSNAITLSNKVQLIIRFYGNADEIHSNYDFVHCINYWSSAERQLVLKQPALESLLSKELQYIGSKYPLASVIRTRKFLNRGWTLNAGQYLKMAYQISNLNLSDMNVLEDQLVGVDTAYFGVLIEALQSFVKKQGQENKDATIDYGYIATIIDKIF